MNEQQKPKSQVAQEAIDALDGCSGPVVAGLRRHLERERDAALAEEAAQRAKESGDATE